MIGGNPRLWKVSIEGGPASPISSQLLSIPHLSPDGKNIAAVFFDGPDSRYAPMRIAVLPFAGGPPRNVLDMLPDENLNIFWMPGGKALVGAVTSGSVGNLWIQKLDGSPPSKLTSFSSDAILAFAWSPDGKRLALARGNTSSDLVLLRNFDR